MRNEIAAAVLFLVQLIEKNEKFSPDQLECFRRRLVELLTERFKNHWFPDKPFKGQGYRCIRVNGHSRRDSTLESAAIAAGVKYEDLSLPVELTLWVDPHEVCCRFGESKGSYCTLASFDKENFSIRHNKDNCNKENRPDEGSNKIQKNPTNVTMDQSHKPKPLGSSNQNHHHQQQQHQQQPQQQQQQQQHTNNNNNSTGRRRNLNSPSPYLTRNRSWFNHSFSMGFGPHPMNQPPWYSAMTPHFFGAPPSPPFPGHRGSKWFHPSSYPAGFTRFHHWTPRATLKV